MLDMSVLTGAAPTLKKRTRITKAPARERVDREPRNMRAKLLALMAATLVWGVFCHWYWVLSSTRNLLEGLQVKAAKISCRSSLTPLRS